MLNGLDLFSGIGGITKALEEWVRPVAYCELDKYARSILLSNMAKGKIPVAPIWDNIRTLKSKYIPLPVDIIYGGFPCQDISVAGTGRGLSGKRSGLFFEIVRLIGDFRPGFVFLENVPAISVRGLDRVLMEFAAMGYNGKWTTVSAAEVGAYHIRERWFFLAHANSIPRGYERQNVVRKYSKLDRWHAVIGDDGIEEFIANPSGEGLEGPRWEEPKVAGFAKSGWWATEPNVGRVAHGIPFRVDRISCLGNAVVLQAAKEAFKRLCGIN